MESLPFAEKYVSKNVISRYLIRNFMEHLIMLVHQIRPLNILEVGCGEGYLAIALAQAGYNVHGFDVREEALDFARQKAAAMGLQKKLTFAFGDIYNLPLQGGGADLLLCCEVLEHLDFPEKALNQLTEFPVSSAIFSVPREPLWRFLNICRLKYLRDFGNTPGHLNHWGKKSFLGFLQKKYAILDVKSPLPWTMALCRKI